MATAGLGLRLRNLPPFPTPESVETAVARLSTGDAERFRKWNAVAHSDYRRTFEQIAENIAVLKDSHVDDSNIELYSAVMRASSALIGRLKDDLRIALEIVADPMGASNQTRISRALGDA